jgi:hypothetical protein
MMRLSMVFAVTALCVGCATQPHSEANVLAQQIARQPMSRVVCPVGDVRVCAIDVDDSLRCECIDHGSMFGRR